MIIVSEGAKLPAEGLVTKDAEIDEFGHVKLGNLVLARTREDELMHRFDPARYPAPAAPGASAAGQLRGIPVVSG